jgi:hypothetical protein
MFAFNALLYCRRKEEKGTLCFSERAIARVSKAVRENEQSMKNT